MESVLASLLEMELDMSSLVSGKSCTSWQFPARPLRVHCDHVFRISFSSLVPYTTSYPIILFTFSLGFITLTL